MAIMTDFTEDFIPYWGVDTSKWDVSGSYSMLAPQGVQLMTSAGDVTPTALTSKLAYDVAVASPAFGKVGIVASVNTNSEMQLIEMSGLGRRWAIKYVGAGTDNMFIMRQGSSTAAWGIVGGVAHNYSATSQAWWRIFYSYDGNMYYQFSPDGVTWTELGHYAEPSPPAASKLRFYHYNTSTATPGDGRMIVYYVNRTTPIPRGTGWLSESFDDVADGDFTPGQQYSDFVQIP